MVFDLSVVSHQCKEKFIPYVIMSYNFEVSIAMVFRFDIFSLLFSQLRERPRPEISIQTALHINKRQV